MSRDLFKTQAPSVQTGRDWWLFFDASIQPGRSGLGIVIRDTHGAVVGWAARSERGMTINEAEYAALIFGLEQMRAMDMRVARAVGDSRVVIEQMRGQASVRTPGLQKWHARATRTAGWFDRVSYTHVPRELNALADAIAGDVLLRKALSRALSFPSLAHELRQADEKEARSKQSPGPAAPQPGLIRETRKD